MIIIANRSMSTGEVKNNKIVGCYGNTNLLVVSVRYRLVTSVSLGSLFWIQTSPLVGNLDTYGWILRPVTPTSAPAIPAPILNISRDPLPTGNYRIRSYNSIYLLTMSDDAKSYVRRRLLGADSPRQTGCHTLSVVMQELILDYLVVGDV
jgi:hypothetical protein